MKRPFKSQRRAPVWSHLLGYCFWLFHGCNPFCRAEKESNFSYIFFNLLPFLGTNFLQKIWKSNLLEINTLEDRRKNLRWESFHKLTRDVIKRKWKEMSYWSQLWLPALKSKNVAEKKIGKISITVDPGDAGARCMGLGIITHLCLTSVKP